MAEDKEVLIFDSGRARSEDTFGIRPYGTEIFRLWPRQSSTRRRILKQLRRAHINRFSKAQKLLRVHGRVLLSALVTMISTATSFVFFPIYLETLTGKDDGNKRVSDGYCACLVLTTVSTLCYILSGLVLTASRFFSNGFHSPIFFPQVSATNNVKIGVSIGLSLLTICYAWEDNKVLCNLQFPLLGLVFVFASITHALSRWRELGFRRSFAILTVTGGTFLSVNFILVDHERCRGIHPPPTDPWTWKVHLVWTLAFVVAIWLWTLAMFSMETAIPQLQMRAKPIEEPGVKLKILRVTSFGDFGPQPRPAFLNKSEIISSDDIYYKVSFCSVVNALFWFNLSTWLVVLSLFWTEFIPGFGKGFVAEDFSLHRFLVRGFLVAFFNGSFWGVVISSFVFGHAFSYLLLSMQSPLVAIGVSCLGFPIVAGWWSMFQVQSPFLIWMPMLSEIVCAVLGFPLILGGTFYLFSLDVLAKSQSLPMVNL